MNKYKIEHKIHTLLHNAAGNNENISQFELQKIVFKQNSFSHKDGWTDDYWIATGEIEAPSGIDAVNIFREKINKICNAISLVGQAFIEYRTFSSLITKKDTDYAIFSYYSEKDSGNNLMILSEQTLAIEKILDHKHDFSIFLEYWKDMTNTPDFISKLILYCAAIDALSKVMCSNVKKEIHTFREEVLGKDLKKRLFGTKENSKEGIRHRLVHGEHLNLTENITLEEIHNAIIVYFNKSIFKKDSIPTGIVSPQRNPYKNFVTLARMIKILENNKTIIELEEDYLKSSSSGEDPTIFNFLDTDENNEVLKHF